MIFSDLRFTEGQPVYIQLKNHIKDLIIKGILSKDHKLPSSRELCSMLSISRNTVISAYRGLEDDGFIRTVKGQGTFVSAVNQTHLGPWTTDWMQKITAAAKQAEELDIMRHEAVWQKGMIAFTSIAPDETLFDLGEFKKAFLSRMNLEGDKILNYGYAQGYKPLIRYLKRYMSGKGVNLKGMDLLVTNGFTEAFNLILSALCKKDSRIICENPTHNTALKIMRLHGLDIAGIRMEKDGICLESLRQYLSGNTAVAAYLIPSYHNPTGAVMSPEKRIEALKLFRAYGIPVIEDGFNEELRYSDSHLTPLIAHCHDGNSIIYIGSLSKILFPGLRIGWILADHNLIRYLESIKRSQTIHTSTLDQAVLYDYLQSGAFERYLKKARRVYRNKYELALQCAEEYIPCKNIWGEGGLHVFLELEDVDSRKILQACLERGVAFTPGDLFHTDQSGKNTMRLGISRVKAEDIVTGFRIIGEAVKAAAEK